MMKKRVVLLLAVSGLCIVAFGQSNKSTAQHFVINGKLEGITGPAKVYVMYRNHGITSDSSELKEGAFTLSGIAEMPQRAMMYLSRKGRKPASPADVDQLAVYLENGTIEVQSADSLKSAKIGGTPLNRDLQESYGALGNVRELQMDITRQYKQEADSAKRLALIDDYKQLDVLLQTNMAAFISSHPNSLVALHMLKANFNPTDNVDLATSLYQSLTDSIQNAPTGLAFKESIDNVYKLGIGKVAPDFAVKDMQGVERHLSDFKGKYVLLDFWASWCGPCRKESPNLVESYATYKNKQFDILSFSLDQNVDEWKKAVKADKYTWTNVKESGNPMESVAKLYGVTAIPTNYLLDPEGKIIAINLRGKELAAQLASMLK